jgi:hypothetical protein
VDLETESADQPAELHHLTEIAGKAAVAAEQDHHHRAEVTEHFQAAAVAD